MAKEFAKKFYNSKRWKDCRKSYIASVHGLCERCSNAGDILHHKILLTPNNIDDPFVTLNHFNLEYLCQDCHNKEHHSEGEYIRDGLEFNERGELVQSPH